MNKLRSLIFCVVMLLSAGCATTGEVNVLMGVGYDVNSGDSVLGRNPISELGIEAQLEEDSSWWFQWHHNSSYADGWPFNDNDERPSDRLGFTYKFKIR